MFVDTEAHVMERPTEKRTGCIGIRRTHMGVTGTLVPESMFAVLQEQKRQGKSGTPRTARDSPSTSRRTTPRSTARSTGSASARSAAGRSARSGRSTNREIKDLRRTLVDEVRRRQKAEDAVRDLEVRMKLLEERIASPKSRPGSKQTKK